MTPELWQRVCRAYDQVSELGPEQRAEYLGSLRQTDAEAAVALEDLLNRRAGADALPGPPSSLLDGLLDTETTGSESRAGKEDWPERIGNYRVSRELARGGMGVVLLAVDEKFNRAIAVKILSRDHASNQDYVLRFLEEAHLMGRLQHPGIPPVHDCGELPDGRPYLAMKLIKGQTLSEMLRARKTGDSDLSRWLSIFEPICHTLAYAHTRGILHRDLKPGNIMVGAHGEVQVMDWGLAKVITRTGAPAARTEQALREAASVFMAHSDSGPTTAVGSVMGTIAYMAPEQARGEVEFLDERCDVFGLGAILCEILTGVPPFSTAKTADQIDMARAGKVSDAYSRLDRCGADAKLIAIAKSCLAPERAQRPNDAGALAQALIAYQAEFQARLKTAEIEQAAAQVKAAEERKRRVAGRRWAALVALFVIAASVAGAWFYIEREQSKLEARQELLKSKVEDALREESTQATDLHRRLDNYRDAQKLISDPSDWSRQLTQRRELLERADNLLAGSAGPAAAELAKQSADARARLAADEKDLTFAQELDAIHLAFFVPLVEEKEKRAATGPNYARFFAERLKMDLSQADVNAFALSIQKSHLRHVLVSALDHWAETAVSAKDKAPPSTLLQVALAADPNPWRDQLRSKTSWETLAHLQRLATELKPAEHSPPILILLANLLDENGGNGFAVLEAALLEHPRNFWLNLTAASQAKSWAQRAGYFQAALAARPDNSAAWSNLGAALFRQHKLVEAMAAYHNAVRIDPKDWNPHRLIGRIHLLEGHFAKARLATDQALQLLKADHPFHSEVRRQADECKRCLDLQDREKLQPIEPAATEKTIAGKLAADDPLDLYLGNNQSPRQSHAVQFRGGKSYQIDLESPDFDPMLRVENVDWLPLTQNDDIIPGKLLNSRIVFTPETDGVFRLVVNSFAGKVNRTDPKSSGNYTLRWREVVPEGQAKIFDGELKLSSPKVDGKYNQEHRVTLDADTPYVFLLTSKRFDPYLRVLDGKAKLIAFNDDIAPGDFRKSRIDFTPSESGDYILDVTAYLPDELGSYSLTVQGFKTRSP